MPYTYEYPRPAVTVDAVVLAQHNQQTTILLIQRKNPPYQGAWAFPGGFVDENETCESAVVRELEEETGIRNIHFRLAQVASTPGRDPRGRTISVVYLAQIHNQPKATGGDDAQNAAWFPIDQLPELAFDHASILKNILHQNTL